MGKQKLKIFLSYHKNTPCYKSSVFQPIHVGAKNSEELLDFTQRDDEGDNISDLNPYYCELTGHYWVLKNYIDTSDDDYIGFCHYRRLPDLNNISDIDSPSIYGMTYSQSIDFFKTISNNKYDFKYDIILPCSVYLYANTVNPILRDNEPHYTMYEQFKKEHNSSLLDILKTVIEKDFPDFINALNTAYSQEKIHSYNIYIMKKELLKKFLEWEFEVLNKLGEKIGGWKQDKYARLAGFIGENLINVWLNKYQNLKKGYVPLYMIDFEADYIQKANEYNVLGDFKNEIIILEEFIKITSDKFNVLTAIADLYNKLSDENNFILTLERAKNYAISAGDYNILANLYSNISDDKQTAANLFKKSTELAPEDKFYAQDFLAFATKTKDLDIIKQAWDTMNNFNLDKTENEKYNHFLKIYQMVKSE